MNPILTFELGGLVVHTTAYRFFMLLAATTVLGLGMAVAARRGLPWRRCLVCLLATAVAVPAGARLLDLATKPDLYRDHPERLTTADLTGFSMFGGLILAALVGALACRRLRLDLARMADSVAPGLGLGIALVRIGCFEAGCCFGEMCDLPWAVTFPRGSEAHLSQIVGGGIFAMLGEPRPVHPTQLYEATAALAAAGLSTLLLRRRTTDGTGFLTLAAIYCLIRVLNHFFRVPGASLSVHEWFYPGLYATIATVATVAMVWRSGWINSRDRSSLRAPSLEEALARAPGD